MRRRWPGRPRRWLAGAACGALLAAPAAVTGLAAPAATAAVSTPPVAQAFTPADQFHGVSCPTSLFCMAVGWYIPADGIRRPVAGRWDGSSWHLLFPPRHGGAPGSELNMVSCPNPSVCLAIGDTAPGAGHAFDPRAGKLFAERWNGRTWRMVPISTPTRADLHAVSCASAQSCFAVGHRSTKADRSQAITEHWNGQRWSPVTPVRPQPESLLLGVSCPGLRNCYASGLSSAGRGAVQRALIEHWNGIRWSTRPLPGLPRNSALASVSCPSGAQCTAVGSAGTRNSHMLVDNLHRGRWTAWQPANQKVAGNPSLRTVSCRAGRVCSAEVSFILNDTLEWGFASRGPAGGWHFQVPGDVSSDTPWSLSCAPNGACMLVGAKGDNSGRGDHFDIGSTLAWRGSGTGFAPVTTPPPPATVGGR
jgi:hypothetical protein